MLRRLGKDSNHDTWKLTLPEQAIIDNEWSKGMYLYFRCKDKIFTYSNIEREGSRKLKLQHTNVWFVHVPNAIIEICNFQKGQQFTLTTTKNTVTFNPYEYGNKLYELLALKRTVNNLPKRGGCNANLS